MPQHDVTDGICALRPPKLRFFTKLIDFIRSLFNPESVSMNDYDFLKQLPKTNLSNTIPSTSPEADPPTSIAGGRPANIANRRQNSADIIYPYIGICIKVIFRDMYEH